MDITFELLGHDLGRIKVDFSPLVSLLDQVFAPPPAIATNGNGHQRGHGLRNLVAVVEHKIALRAAPSYVHRHPPVVHN